MKQTGRQMAVTAMGAATSILTAIILSWIEQKINLSIYSIMIWFIVPIGAIGAGFVAASGYYLGSVVLNYKPQKGILFSMIVFSAACYLLIQFFDYKSLNVDGTQVSSVISFAQYLDLSASSTAVQFRSGGSVALGSMGYVHALLQIIGFALGGFLVYVHLSTKLFCDTCSRYFSNKGKSSRFIGDEEKFESMHQAFTQLIEEDKAEEAIKLHAEQGGELKKTSADYLRTDLVLKHCKSCGQHHLALDVLKWNGKDDWDKIDELSVEKRVAQSLAI